MEANFVTTNSGTTIMILNHLQYFFPTKIDQRKLSYSHFYKINLKLILNQTIIFPKMNITKFGPLPI